MEMQFEHITIQADCPSGVCRSRFTVEGDVAVPGSLREATHVLHASAVPVVENAEAAQDRASFSGRVVFCVLYTQGDSVKVESIEATADFTHQCDMPGAKARANIRTYIQPERVEASVQNGRMTIRATLCLSARALTTEAAECIARVRGEHVQQRDEEIALRKTVGQGAGDALLREEFALPADMMIHDTLCAWAEVHMQDVGGGQGRAGMEGEVVLEALHASDLPGKPLVVTRHTIPVHEGIDLKGEGGDLLDGAMVIKDVAVASQDMGDGERMLRSEVLLGLNAWADKEEKHGLLTDAYTVQGDELRLTHTDMRVRSSDHRMQAAESGKVSILLPEGAKPLRTVLAAFVTPVLKEAIQQGNRLMADGILNAELIYMSDGEIPVSARVEAPFRASFHAEAAPEDLVVLTAGQVEAVPITSDRAELRYILHAQIDGVRSKNVSLVTEASAVPANDLQDGIVLCFAQPGESAWDVARRYRITQSDLQTLNPGMTEALAPGQGVIVWRKHVV